MQRLVGATLLIFANKQDLPGAMTAEEIKGVSGVCCMWRDASDVCVCV